MELIYAHLFKGASKPGIQELNFLQRVNKVTVCLAASILCFQLETLVHGDRSGAEKFDSRYGGGTLSQSPDNAAFLINPRHLQTYDCHVG